MTKYKTINAKTSSIIARENLDFKLGEDIPKYWFGGDPMRTRLADAVMASFPEGERFFISSVRNYRDQITDPELLNDVKNFTRQEAQHGILHSLLNDRLREQGLPIDEFLEKQQKFMRAALEKMPPQFNIALTSAAEHFTALLAEVFFSDKSVMADAHPKIRALLAWHAIEEMEHKNVAFDVLTDVAKVNYLTRVALMSFFTVDFTRVAITETNRLLKADGFTFVERMKFIKQGLNWLLGKNGVLKPLGETFAAYFKRDFHPSQIPHAHNYGVWLESYAKTGNPIMAGEDFYQAAHDSQTTVNAHSTSIH